MLTNKILTGVRKFKSLSVLSDSENVDISSNIDHTTYDGTENDGRDNRKGSRDRKDRKDDSTKRNKQKLGVYELENISFQR